MNPVPDGDAVFGAPKLPPRRESGIQIVEKSVPVPILHDEAIQGYWIGHFGVTPYGIYIDASAGEQEWLDFRRAVETMESAGDWGKADWCRYGLDTLGKKAEEIAPLIGMSVKSVTVYASVSRAASDGLIRINSPSFSHFRLVQEMNYDEQLAWMQQATEHRWSVRNLRAEIRRRAGVIPASRITKNEAKKALAQHKREIKSLVEKGENLPLTLRQDLAEYLRQAANELYPTHSE